MGVVERIKVLESLTKLSPSASDLHWELATLWEARGTESLKRGAVEEALAAYRKSVKAKVAALANVDEKTPGADVKRVILAGNYVGIATLERATGRFDEARADCESAIRTLEEMENRASGRYIATLRGGAEILADARALWAELEGEENREENERGKRKNDANK